jgi:phenylpropionate dioxygenase-like ring-hydroxylating dioxygenase large terminal subunit
MVRYADNPGAIEALVRDYEVHRDVYVDQEVFVLELKHLFANTWVYIGHASQIPQHGDYLTTDVGGEPLVAVRHADDSVRVLYNRCAHKGTKLVANATGNTGKFFRCPYHAWSYDTDGDLRAIPLRKGYEDTGFENSNAARGMRPVAGAHVYREFIFVRLAADGPSFESFFGDSLSSLDNMVDRSPVGRLEVAGPPLRYMHRCNWKMLVENQTDTCHPMVVHESSAATAVRLWEAQQKHADTSTPMATPMAVEVIAPFASRYEFFEQMGIRVWDNGHGHTGVHNSIHSEYSAIPGYYDQMVAAYGEARAQAILGESRHNTVYFPNIMVKGPIQQLRLFKPIAANRTLVESYIFRLVDAPDMLLARTAMYNRLINAPTSMVGHDDLEMYERMQLGLGGRGNDWVNNQRLYRDGEFEDPAEVDNGTTERLMRSHFRAWSRFMTMSMAKAA